MKRKTFISSVILFALSMIACGVGHYYLLSLLISAEQDSLAWLVIIFLMPLALIVYGVQFVLSAIYIPLFSSVIKKDDSEKRKKASRVLITISVVAVLSVIAEFIYITVR